MKYKKGSIVEVLNTNEVSHSWRCAQIISGNKNGYNVRYNIYHGFTNEEIVERVSTKFIRPCPPLVDIKGFRAGDVVEVFHDLSWKMAIVSKVFSWDLFLVRLVGSLLEFEVSKSEIRVRQSWQNDEWVVIGKQVHINSKDGHCNNHNLNSSYQEKQHNAKHDSYIKHLHFDDQNNNLQESHIVSTKSLKRGSPYCFSQDEVTTNKFKITQKDGKRLKVVFKSPEKVDNVPNFRESNDDNDDCVTCSVGSCSINSYNRYDDDNESNDSDAESVYQVGFEKYQNLSVYNNKFAEDIHKLELQAYRCTIEALHASGPLTWEKETMVTNLRMLLHISNDEHLIQLKNLISTRNSIHTR